MKYKYILMMFVLIDSIFFDASQLAYAHKIERRLKRPVVTCPVCEGAGRVVCPNCGGSGIIQDYNEILIPLLDGTAVTICPICSGNTTILCPRCNGSGKIIVK